jgi:hypothetical protein
MWLIACVLGAFFGALALRKRGRGVFASIALGAVVVPVVVAFVSFVYPAEPKTQMWAMIAIPVSYFWGLVAAGLGCGFAVLLQRGQRDA